MKIYLVGEAGVDSITLKSPQGNDIHLKDVCVQRGFHLGKSVIVTCDSRGEAIPRIVNPVSVFDLLTLRQVAIYTDCQLDFYRDSVELTT